MNRVPMATLAVLAISSFLPVALAQSFGEISGSVTDSRGAVVAGVTVAVKNTATNQVRQVQSNGTGSYAVPFLVPGSYDVQTTKDGFRGESRKAITLQVGDALRIDFQLAVGSVSEVVEVTGGAPLLATESTALGTV